MCQHNLPCSIVLPTACFPEGPSPHFTFFSFWRRRPRLEAVEIWHSEIVEVNHNAFTVKADFSGHSKEDKKLVFKTDYRLLQVKSIAEYSKRAFCNTFDHH